MAEIFNNRVCVFANELIAFDSQRKVGCKSGFVSRSNYDKMKANRHIIVLRRSVPGSSALVDFETMRQDVKKRYIQI